MNHPDHEVNVEKPDWVDKLLATGRSTRWHASSTRWQVAREVSAVEYLSTTLGNGRFLPPIGGWSVDYSVVAAVLDAVGRMSRPVNILELGSGAGTPWFASIARKSGGCLVSVEHNPDFVSSTRTLLEHYDLADSCVVTFAALNNLADGTRWYDVSTVLAAIGDKPIDVLIVDGPPNEPGHKPRRPALFALQHRLAADALVVFDDLVRDEEQRTLSDWQEKFGDRLRQIPILDRAAVFRFTGGAGESGVPLYSLDGTLVPDSDDDAEERT